MTDVPLFPLPVCVCGHPITAHHLTPGGRHTWCTTWDPAPCRCTRYIHDEGTD